MGWVPLSGIRTAQLVTACNVGILLKGEVLGSSNAKRTDDLIMESERTHNVEVGVGALHACEPGVHVAGSFHGTCCHTMPLVKLNAEDSIMLSYARNNV